MLQCYAEVLEIATQSDDGPAEPASSPTFWFSRLSFLGENPKLVSKELCFLFAIFSP